VPRRALAALASLKNKIMKSKLILTAALGALALNAPAWSITNILIGVDANSNAWSKVNANNTQFTGWLNQMTATNNLLAAQAGAVRSDFTVITNQLGVYLGTGRMSFDGGLITSDGSGQMTLAPSGGVPINLGVDGISLNSAVFILHGSALTAGDNLDLGDDGSASFASGNAIIRTNGAVSFDNHEINSDGSGNLSVNGGITAVGGVAAATLSGNGALITALPGSQLVGPVTNQIHNISGVITNGWMVLCQTNSFGTNPPVNPNYVFLAISTNLPGRLFIASNTTPTTAVWMPH
jgi:hypothetical protein